MRDNFVTDPRGHKGMGWSGVNDGVDEYSLPSLAKETNIPALHLCKGLVHHSTLEVNRDSIVRDEGAQVRHRPSAYFHAKDATYFMLDGWGTISREENIGFVQVGLKASEVGKEIQGQKDAMVGFWVCLKGDNDIISEPEVRVLDPLNIEGGKLVVVDETGEDGGEQLLDKDIKVRGYGIPLLNALMSSELVQRVSIYQIGERGGNQAFRDPAYEGTRKVHKVKGLANGNPRDIVKCFF